MITDEEDYIRARALPLEIVWRNPLCLVLTKLRLREASNLYYGWAEQDDLYHLKREPDRIPSQLF
jgi:hypothetical protein